MSSENNIVELSKEELRLLLQEAAPVKESIGWIPRDLTWLSAKEINPNTYIKTTHIPLCNLCNYLNHGTFNLLEEYHAKYFDMSQEYDVLLYCLVQQRILHGWYKLIEKAITHETGKHDTKIWLEWTQRYYYWSQTEESKDAVSSN